MLPLFGGKARLCDRLTRREMLRLGGLGALGLSLPALIASRAQASAQSLSQQGRGDSAFGRAKSCIVLFLMGAPPQHSTWDPKPDATAQVRGDFGPISTAVPGVQICELMPRLARWTDRLAILRAMSTGDNAHSSSGYYMMTGRPHVPMNFENANPGAPNDWPTLGALVQALRSEGRGQRGERRAANSTPLPPSIRLPHRIFNTDGSVWPGQDSGFLGRAADPWLFTCQPGAAQFRIPEFSLDSQMPSSRLGSRHTLLERVDQQLRGIAESGMLDTYNRQQQRAFDILLSAQSGGAVQLDREPAAMRDRYGRSPFGQSVLLARRLIEAGVGLVQVNWFRGPDEPPDNPCWDSHTQESERLRTVLVPPMDQAFAALLEDLSQRGMLDETLVVCMAEFGRTPRFNNRGGRDHWGPVFSIALAGGGIRGGIVHGASDAMGAQPRDGRVLPQDLTATILHCLGIEPTREIHDRLGRPVVASQGEVIKQILS
ncbi:MAG: DUF1501 domain-containing protein [Gemmataceae bacterium]|nr:DUF1501 domain-containing protein [Gemmataceae bacterium]